jgi:hypothetical protein
VAPEAALEWRACGGGDAERGEVEGASEGVVRVVRRGAAAAERGAVEGRRGPRGGVIRGGGGGAEGFEAEAGGDGAAEAGQEEASWMEAEVEERWCHG